MVMVMSRHMLLFLFCAFIVAVTAKPCIKVKGSNSQQGCESQLATKEEIVAALSPVETEVDPNYDATWWNSIARKRSKKVCAHPIQPANGLMSGTTTNIGDQYHFACKPGFRLVGSATITCHDHVSAYGLWSDYYPFCVFRQTTSDVALPQSASCNFEDNVCGFMQDDTDQFDWTRFTGATKSRLTGPSFDHTYKETYPGHYMYAESSSPRKINEKSRLYSLRYPASPRGYCVVFWYHMYGENIGSMNVYIKRDKEILSTPDIRIEGNQGNTWKRAQQTVNGSVKGFRIVFEAVIGIGYRGDIAIDDINISHGPCGLPPVG